MKSDGYSFFRTGKVFCAKKKKGEPFALFIIKQSITIPSRPFLHIDDKDERYINKEIKKAVHEALQGDGK
jgi:phage gpG-like protein